MKTLDETIAELEDEELFADALHYLKELRDMTDIPMEYFEYGGTSQKLRNTSQITCPKCHSEFVILPESNNALTWQELKQMEGKPVWVETQTKGGRWMIFERICSVYELGDVAMFSCDVGITCYKKNLGKTWQAYRKERNEES